MSDTVNGTIKALDGADAFADYFRRNYPRDTIISSPHWTPLDIPALARKDRP